jgi:hypothetical protein
MRYELEVNTDQSGASTGVSWAVRDDRDELVALGASQLGNATNMTLLDAFQIALELAERNVVLNGGVQAAMQF